MSAFRCSGISTSLGMRERVDWHEIFPDRVLGRDQIAWERRRALSRAWMWNSITQVSLARELGRSQGNVNAKVLRGLREKRSPVEKYLAEPLWRTNDEKRAWLRFNDQLGDA